MLTRVLIIVLLIVTVFAGMGTPHASAAPSVRVTYSGAFTTTDQWDVYPITVAAGETYTLTETMPLCETASNTDPLIVVYYPDGSYLSHNDDIPSSGGNYCSQLTVTFPAAGTYSILATTNYCYFAGAQSCTVPVPTEMLIYAVGPYTLTIDQSSAGGPDILFNDGRLNDKPDMAGQTAAVYCKEGSIEIYGLYAGKGYLAFRVTKSELAEFTPGSTNKLVKQKNGIRLYLLTTGELQINALPLEAGKADYVFIFDNCLK